MNKHIKLPKYIMAAGLLLLAGTSLLAADGPDAEKKKVYSKSYALDGNDKVSINNQFGEVKITTWGKSEVKVDITIIGKGSTEEKAQEVLDLISIEDSKNGGVVSFKTNLKSQHQNWNNNGDNKNIVTKLWRKLKYLLQNQYIVFVTGE